MSNVATKDVATQNISVALLTAKQHGVELVEDFVRQRLIKSLETGTFTVSYHATLRKNKALTLANLYKEKISLESNRKLVVKTDKDFLCVLIAAYEGGRNINLKNILKHELCKVPISLASVDGELRTAEKASLQKEILKGIECPKHLPVVKKKSDSILIIDGLAFILSLGRPHQAETFGDYAGYFIKKIWSHGFTRKFTLCLTDTYPNL